jgi:ankyrin repeat protein
MEDTINKEVFNLIKNNNFDQVYKLISTGKLKKLDFRDSNFNYFIQYIVNFNQFKILELIVNLTKTEKVDFRVDIIDTDGRSILYNCIKYNYISVLNLLIEYNKTHIGISILDIKDRLGLTALHYSVIFNNEEAFIILLTNGADPYSVTKDGANVFTLGLMYKRNQMINYLLDNKYQTNFVTHNGETLLQIAINYQNSQIIDKLLNTEINLNNISSDFGLGVLHQSIILDNYELFKKLLDKNIDINQTDFYGNSPLHYILIDKRINYIDHIFNKPELKFNLSNINGDIPLHILLDSDIDWLDLPEYIINKIFMESDLNIQNNQGHTCFMKIINNDLVHKFKSILTIKPLIYFMEDSMGPLTDDVLTILVDSFYNQIKLNKKELLLDWEKWCSTDSFDKLKTIIKTNGITNSEQICKLKIKEIIVKEKRTLPKLSNININFDNGIFINNCYYTGSPIDILFGLILLNQDFKSKGLGIILDYPLTVNTNLELYYKKIGLDYPYKLDFSNIEIIWSFQKIFYPSYFDDEISVKLKESKYITIPIGIETSVGSHANILFWDVQNKIVERFEPNGSNFPIGLNYNPELLDNLLENKFKQFEPNLQYYAPKTYLPPISFQMLENLETPKCKKIGDPNGFCGVWCIWWVYQRMLNIDNATLNVNNIADQMIKWIKFDNQSFKNIIRNFSKKITSIRDEYLKKFSRDINDWIVGNYTKLTLDALEKDIFKLIKKH